MFNLKDIISSIADVGQKLFKKKELKKNDLDTLLSLCDDLISNKGAAFGITVARDVTDLYQTLTTENKKFFFKKINEKFKPSHTKVSEAIENYQKTQNDKNLYNLFLTSEGKRRELFRRMNMAPNGISTIVSLREDLLKILKDNPELKSLDDDLRELFKSWFNPGFLRLAKITWDTKAAVLEKIMKYERVHKIKDMDELKRRLGEDRRFFSYFHPALEDEPIIFVQVALTNGLGKSIQEINKVTDQIIDCQDLYELESLIELHESIISNILSTDPIQKSEFKDYKDGKIKSLGSWGGDFILATTKNNNLSYFKNKGFNTIFPLSDLVYIN